MKKYREISQGGETGRRAWFRTMWGNPWRFESSPWHEIRKDKDMLSTLESQRIQEEVSDSARTDRDSSSYFSVFGYSNDVIGVKGKSILDIGTGDSDFSAVAKQRGAKSVVSLDPGYQKLAPKYNKNSAVASFAQALPFRNEVFDEVVASWSIYWIKTGLNKALLEMIRVTKIGGEVKIYPVEVKHFLDDSDLPPQIDISTDMIDIAHTLRIKKDDLSINQWKEMISFLAANIHFGPLARYVESTTHVNSVSIDSKNTRPILDKLKL